MGRTVIEITVTKKGAPDQVFKDVRPAINAAMEAAIEHWHAGMLKRHFEGGAEQRYGYKPRTKKYLVRKLRVKGHNLPLVWSGTLRTSVLRRIELRSLKSRPEATGRMKAPRYVYMTPSLMYKHHLAKEIVTTTADEAAELAKVTDDEATRILNEVNKVETVRLT